MGLGLDSMPALLRHARATYGRAMRGALVAAGFTDVPVNGLYVLGNLDLDGGSHPFGRLVEALGISKQAAGQLVDVMVARDYLVRSTDPSDGRKVVIALSQRGRQAGTIQREARARVDADFEAHIGKRDMDVVRRALLDLVALGESSKIPNA